MKHFKKIMTPLVVAAMVSSVAAMPVLADSYIYEKEANTLNELGLYKGISTARFEPDLGSTLDRQTGVVMLLRMFGQEEEAKSLTDQETNTILSKFKDSVSIASWSRKQVAYAVDKGFVKGYSEDSTFRPSDPLNAKAYCSLFLQQLGYDGDFQYDRAASKLSEIGGLTAIQGNLFNNNAPLIKDSLVGISYGALNAKYKETDDTLLEWLIGQGIVSEQAAKEAGFTYAEIVSVEDIDDISVNIGDNPKLPTKVMAEYDDGSKNEVAVSWPDVDTSKASEQTITGTVEGSDITIKVTVIVVPDELSVKAVSAGNLKELLIEFSKPVEDVDAAEDKGNYDVEGNVVSNAELSDDEMTVTLLLKDTLKQQEDVEITVDKKVGLDKNTKLYVDNVKDLTTPEIIDVVAVGNQLLKVTFSEPVQNATSVSGYLIDDKTFGSSQSVLSDNGKTVSFKLGKKLSSGLHTLTVKDKICDYVDFYIEDKEADFEVVDDDKAPTAEIKSATQTKVVIRFNEEIEKPDVGDIDTDVTTKVTDCEIDDSNMLLTVYFDIEHALPAAGCKITIDNVSDFSGNNVDISLLVEPEYDVTRPEFVGYAIEDQKSIILEFSENVFSEYGKFTLEDADDDTVSLAKATYYKDDDDNDVESKLVLKREDGEEFESGKYELVIREVTDLTPLKNEIIEDTVQIDVDDKSEPEVSSIYVKKDDNQVYIKFNETVDKTSATEYSNYHYMIDSITIRINEDMADVELLSDNQTVCITFSEDKADYKDNKAVSVSDISRMQIESVKDVKGNEMSAISMSSKDFKTDNTSAPEIKSVTLTDKNTIVLELSGSIDADTIELDDFVITAGKETLSVWDASYDSDNDEITLSLNEDISVDGKYNGNVLYFELEDAEYVDTQNILKQKLTSSRKEVKEDFKPVAKSISSAYYEKDVGTVAFVELSEDLKLNSGDKLSDSESLQFRVKADGKTVEADIYYYKADSRDDSKTDVDESYARFKVVVDENYQGDDIQVLFYRAAKATIVDGSGNALEDFEFTKEVE